MKRISPRAGTLLLFLVSCLVSLAALEIALRVYERWRAARPIPDVPALSLLAPNPHGTGSYRMKPNLDVETAVGRARVRIRTNSHGMRWREVGRDKPAGRRRIAFLGDSFTFGCWADSVEDSFVGVFERNISTRMWEVLNFGIGGYGPPDEELQLKEDVLRFSPDFVIVVFYCGNDMRDAWLGIDKARLVNGTAQLIDANVRARVPPHDLPDDTTLCRRAPQGFVKRQALRLATMRFLAPWVGLDIPAIDFSVNRNFTMYPYWSMVPYSQTALAAKDETLACYQRMHDLARARGIGFGIVALPYKEQALSRQLAGPDFDIAFPQAYVQIFARERGIPYLDLLPIYRESLRTRPRRLYMDGDTHLNQDGHRFTGELLADWFRSCVKTQPRPIAD
jgi:lysophospholipase L1-like esterase